MNGKGSARRPGKGYAEGWDAWQSNTPELLKTAEVAERLNVSRDKVLQLVKDGTLRSLPLGPKTVRIYADSVNELIQGTGCN